MTRGLRVATMVARDGLLCTLSRVSEINDQPPLPKPASCGFFYVRRKPPCCNSKHPKTCTPSLTPLSPGSRPDQSTDHQFPRRSSLLPALGRQRQAVSSPPQHLVSGLDRERTHPLVAKTFRFQRIPALKPSLPSGCFCLHDIRKLEYCPGWLIWKRNTPRNIMGW